MNDLALPSLAASNVWPEANKQHELYRWTSLSDGNLDELPENLCPKDNCPTCGAAWVDYVAVGWTLEFRPGTVRGEFQRESWLVRQTGLDFRPIEAVRLVCHVGHHVGYDGRRLFVFPPLSWAAAVIGVGAMVLGAFYLATAK